MSLFNPTLRERFLPIKVSHLNAHCSIQGPTDWCLSLRPCPDAYLLTPIPGGPHTGIDLAETVPPNVKLGPDLVHHSAQFCQRWVCRRGMEMEQPGLTNQTAMSSGSGTTRQLDCLPRDPPTACPTPSQWLTLAGDKLGQNQGTGSMPSLLGTVICALLPRAYGEEREELQVRKQGNHRLRSRKKAKCMVFKSGATEQVLAGKLVYL